jgi:nucleoid-associated protein YgaU
MKTIFICCALLALATTGVLAQDAAVEERLNKLGGQIEDLLAAQAQTQKQVAELARELASMREQMGSFGGHLASQEDLRRLTEKVAEIDKKRAADNELVARELEKLGRAAAAPVHRPRPPVVDDTPAATGSQKGYEYVIQKGDTISTIVQAYREKGAKVTVTEILNANPGLNPSKLPVGKKIFIPAPKS